MTADRYIGEQKLNIGLQILLQHRTKIGLQIELELKCRRKNDCRSSYNGEQKKKNMAANWLIMENEIIWLQIELLISTKKYDCRMCYYGKQKIMASGHVINDNKYGCKLS